jgi:hypothetical protein
MVALMGDVFALVYNIHVHLYLKVKLSAQWTDVKYKYPNRLIWHTQQNPHHLISHTQQDANTQD